MKKMILASNSPRRKELLERFDMDIKIVGSNFIEKENPGETPIQIAMSLALSKALSVSKNYKDDIVLGADTIVVYNNIILGKPKDGEDAYRILDLLSGNTHEVITGVSIIREKDNIKIIDYEKTIVKFRKLNHNLILKYIETKEPLDKAGAYGIQGVGEILVEKIDGCYSNVVGLPLTKIDFYLDKYFGFQLI